MEKRRLTSVVSYPERGEGGRSDWRGNCSPKLIEDLIEFYKPNQICDYMCGSGTTKAAADTMGITSKIYDLHSGFDIMNSDIPERSEFTFWHPPYWDIIKYSDVMYKASEVEARFGYNPCEFDLSRIREWDDFVKAMNYAMMKQFCALERGGRMAVLMGDIKRKGKLYSMLAEIAKPGTLEQIIIKMQHNCVSSRTAYSGHFIPIEHEYIMIVKKDDQLIIPVMLSGNRKLDVRDAKCSLWRDVLAAVMETKRVPWSLAELYGELDGHKKTANNPNWQAKVRQTLQKHTDLFRHDGRGMWSLATA